MFGILMCIAYGLALLYASMHTIQEPHALQAVAESGGVFA